MSYDIYIIDPETNETRWLDKPNPVTGGTRAVGGTDEAWLNVTYNYSPHYYKLWGHGLGRFHGMKVSEVKPKLEAGVVELGCEMSEDYWAGTQGNAGAALADLLTLFGLCEDGDEIAVC